MRSVYVILISFVMLLGCMPTPQSQKNLESDPSRQAFRDAKQALDLGNVDEAVAIWTSLAEQSDSSAMIHLGMLYSQGEHTPEDLPRATRWFQSAADLSNKYGQYEFGLSLLEGRGIDANGPKAMEYLTDSATQGESKAQLLLAKLYSEESSELFDSHQAMKFARSAADIGNAEAQYLLATLYENSGASDSNLKEARDWHLRAAEQDYVASQLWLGRYYRSQTESYRYLETSRSWLMRAQRNGSEDASDLLAEVEDELFINANDIDELNEVWHDNKLKFDKLYVGKTFRSEMPFFNVSEVLFKDGVYKVEFGDNIMFGDIICHVSDGNALSQVAEWSEGQVLQIQGVIAEHEGMSIRLSKCTFQ